MRCKVCEYRLWNLPSRQCPECGTPFRPSDFEFVPNSVRFCCPHCNQAYYGTDAHGHLVPREFDCVQCAAHVHMDDMVLLPTAGLEEEETQVEQMPWLDRSRRGFMRGWWSTVGHALVRPSRLMQLTPLHASTASAWWFAVVTNTLLLLLTATVFLILPILVLRMPMFGTSGGAPVWAMGAPAAGVCCGGLTGFVLFTAVEGLMAHGLLRLTGRTAGGLGRTYQAVCYSSGANAVSAVPCLGWYFGWVWWMVSAVVMVKEGQRVGAGRAALAVLTFPVLGIAAGVALWLSAFLAAMSATGSATPTSLSYTGTGGAPAPTETQTVTTAILDYANQHAGRGPDHALRLLADGFVMADDFVLVDTATYTEDVPLGIGFLDGFGDLAPDQQDRCVRLTADALPAGTVAHRLGDFVFTYHGADLRTAPRSLWTVMLWPDPEANASAGTARNVYLNFSVGLADGTIQTCPARSLQTALDTQNQLRATQRLAPLPHPATIKHVRPPK